MFTRSVFNSVAKHPRTEAELNLHRVNQYGMRFSLIPAVAIIALIFTADSLANGLKVAAFSILACAAAFAVGGILGFLFGIPRSVSQNSSIISNADSASGSSVNPPENTSPKMANTMVNTNLVQISDWLTKVLVGATLTQIEPIYLKFTHIITTLAATAGTSSPLNVGVVGGLLVYGLAFGFIWGHLWTTLFLVIAYCDVENTVRILFDNPEAKFVNIKVKQQLEVQEPIDNTPTRSRPSIEIDDSVKSAAKDIVRVPFEQLTTAEHFLTWARAQTALSNIQEAEKAYRRAIALRNGDVDLRIELAQALASNKRSTDAAKEYSDIIHLPGGSIDDARRITAQFNALLNLLYVSPPEGFQEAIRNLPGMEAEPAFQKNAHFWVLVACAHGQAYEWLDEKSGEDDAAAQKEIEEHKQKALAAVQKALMIDPNWITFLRQIWNPKRYGGSPGDEDLVSLSDDKDFENILGDGWDAWQRAMPVS